MRKEQEMRKTDIAVAVYGSHTQADDAVPKDSVLHYETALKADVFLVILHGGGADIRRAREVLAGAGGIAVQTHGPAELRSADLVRGKACARLPMA
jgi:hypothetical protein